MVTTGLRARCRCGCGRLLTARQAQRGGIYATRRCFGIHARSGVVDPVVRQRAAQKATMARRDAYVRQVIAEVKSAVERLYGPRETLTLPEVAAVAHRLRKIGYARGYGACWRRWQRDRVQGAA